jgi:ubiquitin-protein ligase
MSTRVTLKNRKYAKALTGHFKRCTIKSPHPNILFVMNDNNIGEWYFLMGAVGNIVDIKDVKDFKSPGLIGEISGNNDEFLQGQFIGKITATSRYPYSPPDVVMLTPTGVYPLNNKDFCIDIGRYHKENWPPSYGCDGMVKMIMSGLIGWRELGGGINLMVGHDHDKHINVIKKASKASVVYNQKHNSDILDVFREAYGTGGTMDLINSLRVAITVKDTE